MFFFLCPKEMILYICMEPIPSHPHASRNLAISLFVLVLVVLLGVFWYRYEHQKVSRGVNSGQELTDEQKQQVIEQAEAMYPAPEYSEADQQAVIQHSQEEQWSGNNLTDEQKTDIFNKLNSR